jgi:hypothetical protein
MVHNAEELKRRMISYFYTARCLRRSGREANNWAYIKRAVEHENRAFAVARSLGIRFELTEVK